MIPFTLLVMLPTNQRLLHPDLGRGTAEARQLLEHWGRLHAVRSATSTIGFLVLVTHLTSIG